MGEKVQTIIHPKHVEQKMPELDFDKSKPINVDAHLLHLNKVEDLFKDQTTFYKKLRRGEGSASPYYDCFVTIKVSIKVDGVEKFAHKDMLECDIINDPESCARFDLEEYTVPSVIRKILKTTKLFEVVQVRCRNIFKLTDHLDDGLFKHDLFMGFKEEVVLTFQLLNIEQKEYLFKLKAAEKIERIK